MSDLLAAGVTSVSSWPGLARPPTTSYAAPSKVPGDRAKPGHDEGANPRHPAAYPDAHGAEPGHDEWANPPHSTAYPDAYGAWPGMSERMKPRPGKECSAPTAYLDASADKPNYHDRDQRHRPLRRWPLIVLPPALALFAVCTVNLAAHGFFAIAPFGNVFLLARVIYDGPGMTALRRDCPAGHWRLCPFLDSFPATSDDFLRAPDSPLTRAGGPKAVSRDAGAILWAALTADPVGEATLVLANAAEQLTRFSSGDGLNPWPVQVTPWIELDFPIRERAAYASARQQSGALAVPAPLSMIHMIVELAGVIVCIGLLPVAISRRHACAGFVARTLLVLPLSAAITGALSAPHDRYQSRIMWLPAFIAAVSASSLWWDRAGKQLTPGNVAALPRTR